MPRPKNPDNIKKEVARPTDMGMAEPLVEKAYQLKAERERVFDQIVLNRRSLRDLGEQGILPEEVVAWTNEFYPPREYADAAPAEQAESAEENGDEEEVPEEESPAAA